jgi:putative membrane protein
MLLAHVNSAAVGPANWRELAVAWEFDPLVIFVLVGSAWLYRRGSLRHRAEVPGRRRWERAAYWAGWWALVVALVSPLHPWGQVLFAAHMTQHEILMLVAAPLLVLGRPMVAIAFALPRGDARAVAREFNRPTLRNAWSLVTRPVAAWLIHGIALWLWHIPALFEATLRHEPVHHLQHASFFGTALLFWWALAKSRARVANIATGLLYLFTTMVHTGALGALLTISDRVMYPAYGGTAANWNLTPLEDQQLGGLIMWIPAGLVYVAAALVILASALRRPATQIGRMSASVG